MGEGLGAGCCCLFKTYRIICWQLLLLPLPTGAHTACHRRSCRATCPSLRCFRLHCRSARRHVATMQVRKLPIRLPRPLLLVGKQSYAQLLFVYLIFLLLTLLPAATTPAADAAAADKYEGADMRVDSHWSEKSLDQMTDRDWRIFRCTPRPAACLPPACRRAACRRPACCCPACFSRAAECLRAHGSLAQRCSRFGSLIRHWLPSIPCPPAPCLPHLQGRLQHRLPRRQPHPARAQLGRGQPAQAAHAGGWVGAEAGWLSRRCLQQLLHCCVPP